MILHETITEVKVWKYLILNQLYTYFHVIKYCLLWVSTSLDPHIFIIRLSQQFIYNVCFWCSMKFTKLLKWIKSLWSKKWNSQASFAAATNKILMGIHLVRERDYADLHGPAPRRRPDRSWVGQNSRAEPAWRLAASSLKLLVTHTLMKFLSHTDDRSQHRM